ncbi:MAG: hypothetical protein GXZ13_01060 [Synergistaceae bacterium]|jgi:competence protein ComEA|nr:hypothetical protein [Synergistaceae bacterium]
MHNSEKNKNVLVITSIVCFLLAAALLYSFKGRFGQETEEKMSSRTITMEDTIDVTSNNTSVVNQSSRASKIVVESPEEEKIWVVYLTGAVKNPGVYHVPFDSRVYQALEVAGGFANEANKEAVNLAASLGDGVHMHFPRKGEVLDGQSSPTPSTHTNMGNVVPGGYGNVNKSLINVNTATQNELESLPGVGPKTAQSIIAYRETKGSFSRIEDLMLIKGIGAKKYDGLKDFVTAIK